jgi:glycosyltransferase involved in cell wall biosynthesis
MAAMSTSDLELSVVMPCLNEARTLPWCITRALTTLEAHGIAGEVIVADNGSTDGSQEIARAHGARVVPVPITGYGAALQGGIAAARGQFVIMGDADASYDFAEIPRLLARLRDGCDLVMGNRFTGGIKPGAMPVLHRYLGNPSLTFLGRLFFRSPIGDFHCGLRGFSREAILGLDLASPGMEFASEMVVKATLRELRIAEVPVTLSPDGRGRPPHLRTWRDGWRHLRFLLIYSPRWLFLYPGIVLMLIGAIIHAALLPGPRVIGAVTVDVHTLLYGGALILVGFQAITFAVFSKVYGIAHGLLPSSPRQEAWFRTITLETGLAVGALLLAGGFFGSIYAVRTWAGTGFGAYDPADAMRVVVPSVVLLALGSQVIFSSFLLSLLGSTRR